MVEIRLRPQFSPEAYKDTRVKRKSTEKGKHSQDTHHTHHTHVPPSRAMAGRMKIVVVGVGTIRTLKLTLK